MTLLDKSLAAFASYATIDEPYLPADEMAALQVRLYRWQIKRFGLLNDRDLVLCLVEKCGELAVSFNTEEVVAGVLLCLTQICTANRLDFGLIVEAFERAAPTCILSPTDIPRLLGLLSRTVRMSQDCDCDRSTVRRWVCDAVSDFLLALPFYGKRAIYKNTVEQLLSAG